VKVSIIVPIYNSEDTLERCISSILKQSFKDFELLLIDDGSTDDSLSICNNFKNIDQRVKVFSIQNSGAAVARNVGLANAAGDYIGFVDSDDWIDHMMYKRLYDLAISKEAEVVSVNFVQDFLNKSIFNKVEYEDGCYAEEELLNLIYPNLICSDKLENNVPYTMVTKIFKRTLLLENDIKFHEPLLGGQDMAFSIKCFLHCNKFCLSKKDYFYHYVYNKNSRTNTYLKNAWVIYKEANKYFEKITKNFPRFDFSKQVHLDLLRGAMSAINYELKPGNKKTTLQKIKKVREIYSDNSLDTAYGIINLKRLTFSRKVLLTLMKKDMAHTIYILSIIRNLITRLKVGR
jgi:glycosyltransferase involved in cell wall biosynthesis